MDIKTRPQIQLKVLNEHDFGRRFLEILGWLMALTVPSVPTGMKRRVSRARAGIEPAAPRRPSLQQHLELQRSLPPAVRLHSCAHCSADGTVKKHHVTVAEKAVPRLHRVSDMPPGAPYRRQRPSTGSTASPPASENC